MRTTPEEPQGVAQQLTHETAEPREAIDARSLPRQRSNPRHRVRSVSEEQARLIVIDGKLDESLWRQIPVIELASFVGSAKLKTTMKAFYSPSHLYIGAYLEDSHVWSTLQRRDENLWTEEVFEVFIAPNGPEGEYIELQVNPLGTLFDAHFQTRLSSANGTRQEQIQRAKAWNMKGLEHATFVEGRVNAPEHADEYWSVEMKIPLDEIPGVTLPFAENASWHVNFYRYDRPEKGVTHTYAWSTAPRLDFHHIEGFGVFEFPAPRQSDTSPIRPRLNPEALKNMRKSIEQRINQQNDENSVVP